MDPSRRDLAIDLGLCVALTAVALPPMLDPSVNDPRATVAGPLLLPVLLAPVFVRRRRPLAAAWLLAAACVVSAVPTFDQFRLIVAVPVALLVLWSLALTSATRPAALGLAVVLAGLAFVGATESVLTGAGGVANMMAFSAPLCGAVWVAGRMAQSRERAAARLTERSAQLRRQREATAAVAVEIDRARLAVDLDHASRSRLREMVALAGLSPDGLDEGRERFARIEVLGREALDQMRGLLGLLRSGDRGARAPRPTLEELDALLAAARAGGRAVDLAIEGERRPLAAGIELAAYRTVQHALVAVGGAGDGPATVALRYLPDELELEVRGPHPGGAAAGAATMAARERVTALGGSFTAATPSPGLTVLRARLPAVASGG